MNEAEVTLRASMLLRHAPDGVVTKLAAIGRQRSYARGATLFIQGEPAKGIGIVASGWMKLYRVAPGGTETVVRIFSAGESFGEAVALRGQPYPVSASAVTECSVLWLDANRLLALLGDEPVLTEAILAATFVHLHDLVNQVEQLKSMNAAQRVAGFLVGLCAVERGPHTVILPYDKMVIAAQLGIKPESLSRAFARLREHGVAIQQNEAKIAEVAALRAYSETDPSEAWGQRS